MNYQIAQGFASHRDGQNVRKDNLQNTAKEPEKSTTTHIICHNNHTLRQLCTLIKVRGVYTATAGSVNIKCFSYLSSIQS